MNTPPAPEPPEPNARLALWVSAMMLLMCGALVGSIVYWSKQNTQSTIAPTQLPANTVMPKATSIPSCLAWTDNVMASDETRSPWIGVGAGMFHWEVDTEARVASFCDGPY